LCPKEGEVISSGEDPLRTKKKSTREYLKAIVKSNRLRGCRERIHEFPDELESLPYYMRYLSGSKTEIAREFIMICRYMHIERDELKEAVITLAPFGESFFNHYIKA
jgi:hypothetical protein